MLNGMPQKVKDAICNNNKDVYYELRENEYHVTSLLGCLRKEYYNRTEGLPDSETTKFHFFKGNIFDEAITKNFKRNQERCTHRIAKFPITIVGKLDAVDEETNTIFDVKVTSNLFYIKKDGAKQSHKDQVTFYHYCNAIPNPRASILYKSDEGLLRIWFDITSADETRVIEMLEENAKFLYTALLKHQPPSLTHCNCEKWMCNTSNNKCSYYDNCYPKSQSSSNDEQKTNKE